jgi:hypothetical protein
MRSLPKLEALLWSIALPGFPQLLTGQLVKGILFVLLEFLINIQSNFNEAIMQSFLGNTKQAAQIIDYQWLMFYPCLYMFAMWDAYKFALQKEEKLAYLPFVFSAYTVTVGLMYSPRVYILDKFIGPIFFPMLCVIPGVIIGLMIKKILLLFQN